jgi:hypothetical protein
MPVLDFEMIRADQKEILEINDSGSHVLFDHCGWLSATAARVGSIE